MDTKENTSLDLRKERKKKRKKKEEALKKMQVSLLKYVKTNTSYINDKDTSVTLCHDKSYSTRSYADRRCHSCQTK